MTKRAPTGQCPDLWELPGGKVHPGEGMRDALRREVREELGVECTYVGVLAAVGSLDWGDPFDFTIRYYMTKIAGDPRLLVGQTDVGYFSLKRAMRTMALCPSLYMVGNDIQDTIDHSTR